MKKFGLILSFVASICTTTFGQADLAAINRPIELLNDANHDIEEGNYETAVQKLIASIRLNPKQREDICRLILHVHTRIKFRY